MLCKRACTACGVCACVCVCVYVHADDPITAAILRAQMATMSILSSANGGDQDRGGGGGDDDECTVKPSMSSFSRAKGHGLSGQSSPGPRDNTPNRCV